MREPGAAGCAQHLAGSRGPLRPRLEPALPGHKEQPFTVGRGERREGATQGRDLCSRINARVDLRPGIGADRIS